MPEIVSEDELEGTIELDDVDEVTDVELVKEPELGSNVEDDTDDDDCDDDVGVEYWYAEKLVVDTRLEVLLTDEEDGVSTETRLEDDEVIEIKVVELLITGTEEYPCSAVVETVLL